MYLPDSPAAITLYRVVNAVVWVPLVLYFAIVYRSPVLFIIALGILYADTYLVLHNTFHTPLLQALRFLAFAVVGPVLVYYGVRQRNWILGALGAIAIVVDGSLFVQGIFSSTR